VTPEERQSVVDEEHLRLLALFHYFSGGLTIAFAAMFGFALAMMSFAFSMAAPPAAKCPPPDACGPGVPFEPPFGLFLALFGVVFALALSLGVLQIVSGRFLSSHKHRVFSLIVAIPGLLFIPHGTLLSVLTLLVLERPSVKRLYDREAPP
jgi:hypothetical protein